MVKKSKLLIATSILMIIFGIVGLVIDGSIVIANSNLSFGFFTSLLLCAVCAVAGFFGIFSKSQKIILGLGLLLIPVVILDALTYDVIDAFSFIFIIWPIFYLWGWQRSNRDIKLND